MLAHFRCSVTGAKAFLGIFVKELEDEVLEALAAFDVRGYPDLKVLDVGEDLIGAASVKRGGAEYEFVQQDAVGPPIDGSSLVFDTTDYFRSDVFRSAHKRVADESRLDVVAFGRCFVGNTVKEPVQSRALYFSGFQNDHVFGHYHFTSC